MSGTELIVQFLYACGGVGPTQGERAMHVAAAQRYSQIALDCVNLADVSRDRATQDTMLRLANAWARLADRAEEEASHATDRANPRPISTAGISG